MDRIAVREVVLSADEVARRPAEPLAPGVAAVANTVLSEHQGTYAGLLRIPAGTTLPRHEHRQMGHHVWVLEGAAIAFDRVLGAGSYWFVPPGHGHAVEALPPHGCTLFYVDVPET